MTNWEKQKARLERRAAVLGAEMDKAIEAFDTDGFFNAYNQTFNCMGAKQRHAYYIRMLEKHLSADRG